MGVADTAAHGEIPASIPELLARRRAEPDGELLVTDDERLSFADADATSLELADALLASGVGKGPESGILFPNCAQWLISWLAAARIGALTVPLSTFAPGSELARLLRHTDTQFVLMGRSIAGRDLVERMQDALPGLGGGRTGDFAGRRSVPAPDVGVASRATGLVIRVARRRGNGCVAGELGGATRSGRPTIWWSSPPRGRRRSPKSVVHTHGSLVRHAFILARHRGVTSSDRIYSPMPFFWVGGLTMVVLQALSTGATVLTQDVFEAGSTLALLERERATFVSCWAQASRAMADHPDFAKRDLSSIRGGTMAEALPPEQRPASAGSDAQHARHDRNRRTAHDGRSARHSAAARTAWLLRDPAAQRG